MSLHAIATVGLRSIEQIAKFHDLRFHHDQNGLAITVELLTSSPSKDSGCQGGFIGFISQPIEQAGVVIGALHYPTGPFARMGQKV